jgi:hypothetical protein
MSTLLLDPPLTLDLIFEHEARRRLDDALCVERADVHGRLTLDDLITGVWEGLAVRDVVHCPVCGGAMAPKAHDHACGPSMGVCLRCGSRLS